MITDEERIESYQDVINMMDAWLANVTYNLDFKKDDVSYEQVEEWCREHNAFRLVRQKALNLIAFIEKKAGK